ncbi:Photosystem I chlorophyll a apoprotein A1 [Capsicum annuum]|nr:Photosystem I chlorophyll a apoprotein A1 [Capsicum annuum]
MVVVVNSRLRSCHSLGSGPRPRVRSRFEFGVGVGSSLGSSSGSGVRGSKVRWDKRASRLRIESCNIGTLQGKSIELMKILRKRRISIACVQETNGDPVKTSFEEWAKPGHFSRTIAKGPDTTTWIWNLYADAHDFDSHTSDLEEISRKLFSAHFGQLSIIFLWMSGMYFHGAHFSNYEAWLSDPTHIGPSAQVVWPIVGQEILNGDVGGGFRGIQITSGFFQIWRASGITSELQLYCTAIRALVFAALMLFAGWFHYHKAAPKLAWFQDVESMLNHHLAGLLGLRSLSWAGHQVHVSLSINQFLNAGVDPKKIPLPHEFILNRDLLAQFYPSFAEGATPFFTLNWSKYVNFLTFRGGLDPVTGGLWLTDIAHHHLAIAILFLIAGHMYKTNWGIGHGLKGILEAHKGPFTGQGHKGLYEILTTSWHAQLSLNLAMLGSLTIIVAHHIYSMPPYPYLATDYGTQLSLFTYHMWISRFLIVGAAVHAAIFMVRDYDPTTRYNDLLDRVLRHLDAIISHLNWAYIFLGFHSFGLYIHNDTMSALGRPQDMFSDTAIQLQPILAQWIQNTHALAPGATAPGATASTSLTWGGSDVWGSVSDQGVVTHITGGNFAQSSITINGWLRDCLWAQASQEDLKSIMALRFPRFSQGLAQDPTTRRIWFGIATAHDFESHDDITEECLYQNIFASHFGQLAIIFLWTSENLFHVSWQGNFESWVQDPLHVRAIAHAIWDPHFGQPAVEAFTRGGALGPVNIAYSSETSFLELKRKKEVKYVEGTTHKTTYGPSRRDRDQVLPAFQDLPAYDNLKDDLGYVEPIEIGAIIPPKLPQGIKFDITSVMILLLNPKGRNFLKIFYQALNINAKVVMNTITGGPFISLHWELALLRIEIGLLMKQLATMNSEKVNVMGAQGKASKSYDADADEEMKYLDRDGKFPSQRPRVYSRHLELEDGKAIVDEVQDIVDVDDAPETELVKLLTSGESSQKLMGVDKRIEKDKGKRKKVKLVVKMIPWPPLPFPQRLKKKQAEKKY